MQAERLAQLANLHRQGILSDDEYVAAVARLENGVEVFIRPDELLADSFPNVPTHAERPGYEPGGLPPKTLPCA